MDQVYVWSDSSVVLGWLNMAPSRLMTFVANRVGQISQKVPSNYVTTNSNPADFASKGLSPQELLQMQTWWDGPQNEWPRRPDINLSRKLPETKARVLTLKPIYNAPWIKFSSYDRLFRTVAWSQRFTQNCR